MPDYATRLAAAYAAAADQSDVGGESAIVAGVPCVSVPQLPFPWATQARPLTAAGPPSAVVVRKLVGWLAARAPQWTIVVRGQHVGALDGFVPSYVMPALLLTTAPPRPSPPAGVTIGLARDPAEFLAVYGADLAPLVTARHFAAAGHHHLIARIDAAPVGCARVRIHGGTAYVSAVTVLQPYRRRGIGAALSAAASRLGSAHADLVWLHAADHARAIYERLGYVQVDEHVQMAPAAGTVWSGGRSGRPMVAQA